MKTKTLFLSLLVLLTSMSVMAYEYTDANGTIWNFTFSGGKASLYAGSNTPCIGGIIPADLSIPSTIEYGGNTYSVTSIGTDAFYNCYSLTSVTIPESVTSIGGCAFYRCTSLTSVTIPASVTSIGDYAFQDCSSLTSVTIPESVTSIPYRCFYGCSSLTSVTIPESVTSIGDEAFSGCSSLTSVTIPESVTSIGERAFNECSSLTSVTIPESVTSIGYLAFSGCSNLPIFDNIRYADTYAVKAVDREQATYTIKDGTKWIGDQAFSGCTYMTSVTIPNSVTSIGANAFLTCVCLTSVTIPESVTSIADDAFSSCRRLPIFDNIRYADTYAIEAVDTEQATYTIKDGTKWIGGSAFYNCSNMTSVTIPESVTSIGFGAFRSCSSLTSVTIPESVTSIGRNAFSYCRSLTSVTIPESVTSIGIEAFYNCSSLTSVTIPASVTSIGESAFYRCSNLPIFDNIRYADTYAVEAADKEQATYTIKEGTKWIGDFAFYNCGNMTSVTIPNSVTSIGRSAFRAYEDWENFSICSSLTSVTIPASVTSIGEEAFYDCIYLTSVISYIQEPFSFGDYAFGDISSNCVLTVPAGTKDAYIAKGWTEEVFKGGIVEKAVNELLMADVRGVAGGKVNLPVSLSNPKNEVAGVQFKLTLPYGVTLSKVSTASRTSAFNTGSTKNSDGSYTVLLYHGNDAIPESDGRILTLELQIDGGMANADYPISIREIVLSATDQSVLSTSNAVSSVLTVADPDRGDANSDGRVNVADIVAIANYILNNPSSRFNATAADVNNDTRVNVADIVGVANLILSAGGNSPRMVIRNEREPE